MRNHTLALFCAALLFTAGCNYKVEVGGEDKEQTAIEQRNAQHKAKPKEKKTEECELGDDDENLNLCATYHKSPYSSGYTIYADVVVPSASSFTILNEGMRENNTRLVVITYMPGEGSATEFKDGIFISDSIVQRDEETRIRVELRDASVAQRSDKDVKRRVVIQRGSGITDPPAKSSN